MNGIIPPLVALSLLALTSTASRLLAAEGYMVKMTAAVGQIKSGEQVLGTAAPGTRRWVFEEKGSCLKVKVPEGEQQAWITANQTERVRLTNEQFQQAKSVVLHWKRGFALIKSSSSV
jgi:hypothetical protein